MRPLELSADEARRLALRAQGLDRRRQLGVPAVLARLGAVQLDTIAVLARSHELVAYARLGAIGRARVEAAYWGHGRTFEYWSHAACILPMERYPDFAFRMRAARARQERWGALPAAVEAVRAALQDGGPQTAGELGGSRRAAGWWQWSDAKNAVEWMLATGEVVVTDRRSWQRVYDLAERAVPSAAQAHWVDDRGVPGPSDVDCLRTLLAESLRVLAVGTLDDILDVHRLRGGDAGGWKRRDSALRTAWASLLEEGRMVRVRVAGWAEPAWADPAAVRRLPRGDGSITTLLSPFDSLVWHRARLERLFGLRLRIEAYTPVQHRKHGYFAMPVLHAGHIIGLVDPARDGRTLVARRITALAGATEAGIGQALADAARWVGSDTIRVEAAGSATQARQLQRAAVSALNA